MDFRPSLSNRSLGRIAVRVGPYLSASETGFARGRWEAIHRKANPTLGPAFEIWVLGVNAVQAVKEQDAAALARFRLKEISENTRSWHLEIRRDKTMAVGFAEAINVAGQGEDEWWIVHRMGLLPAAAREFQRGLERIKTSSAEMKRRPRVRVLRIPGVRIGLLWLQHPKDDQILVFHRPSKMVRISSRRVYGWPEFVKILMRNVERLSIDGPDILAVGAGEKGATLA